jgi:hypothetical protein
MQGKLDVEQRLQEIPDEIAGMSHHGSLPRALFAPSIAVPSVLLLLDSRSLKSDARVTHPQNTQIFNDK